MSNKRPLKLAVMWHMHQPNYQQPGSSDMALPWVRLHALKDYLDMLLAIEPYERVRVTFNLVPSLLDQFDLYLSGGSDSYLDLARIDASQLTDGQKCEILDCFFNANSTNLIKPYDRYHELFRKARNSLGQDFRPALFSSEEMRDLQVWSSLTWVDPVFRDEEPIRTLLAKGRHFTEGEKAALLDWQRSFIGRIIPAYRSSFQDGRADISFTPYYHPILPLLCDTDVAREALPKIALPRRRFACPEDAEWQIRAAMDKFEAVFGRPLKGMWPSEGSVSEAVAQLMMKLGIGWTASDEEVLSCSLRKAGLPPNENPVHAVYEYGPGLKMLFRDHALSDRIGFVYSTWDADRAVSDFMSHLERLRLLLLDQFDDPVVPVILDGENAWESFPDDGTEFLAELYRQLNESPTIEMVTMTEAAEGSATRPLPSLHAGSWINHNFRIWIGHPEDNTAWDLLGAARRALVDFQRAHPEAERARIQEAWRQIYVAEGSDWCWWYGDEHRGANNERFDTIYRQHLAAVYEILGLEVPAEVHTPIHRSADRLAAAAPDALLTPVVDGRLSYFYEWSGAGHFDCLRAGGAMHRAAQVVSRIYFAYDHDEVYIRLDFVDLNSLDSSQKPEIRLVLSTPEPRELLLPMGVTGPEMIASDGYRYAVDECLELAVEREWLWPSGYGAMGMSIVVRSAEAGIIETWPPGEPIRVEVADRNKEMFWPT